MKRAPPKKLLGQQRALWLCLSAQAVHSDHILTTTVSYNTLNAEGLIFGRSRTVNNVAYMLCDPTIGSYYAFCSGLGIPENNKWNQILAKDPGFIKNFSLVTPLGVNVWSWRQDTNNGSVSAGSIRTGYNQLEGTSKSASEHHGYLPGRRFKTP